jgi:hypothetical protein
MFSTIFILGIILIIAAIGVWRFSLAVYEEDTSRWFIYCGIVIFVIGYILMEVYFRFLA